MFIKINSNYTNIYCKERNICNSKIKRCYRKAKEKYVRELH